MSYYLSFIVFWRDGGVEGLSSSLSASLPLFFFLARLKTASLIFFCHSPYSPHLVGCNITIRAIVAFFFSLLSFTYSPSSLSFPPPLLCCLLPLSHFVLFASGLEKKKNVSHLFRSTAVFFPSYMVISLQISAVLPSCLDHSALICEAAESLRTAEHASLEWIYALREVQKAKKKEILHLRNVMPLSFL